MFWFFNQIAHHFTRQRRNFWWKNIKIAIKISEQFLFLSSSKLDALLCLFLWWRKMLTSYYSSFNIWICQVGGASLSSLTPPMATGGADVFQCEQSACSSTACLNGGTCQSVDAFTFQCLCPLGLSGDRCEQGQIFCSTSVSLSLFYPAVPHFILINSVLSFLCNWIII